VVKKGKIYKKDTDLSHMDHKIRFDQSLADLISYASALDEYFDTLIYDREQHPLHFAFAIAKKYDLSKDQLENFKRIALRTFRAQEITHYFEERFGVNKDFSIQDPQGLHALVFRGKYVPKEMDARSYNISIGFTKHNWQRKDALGYTEDTYYDVLFNDLQKTIKKLEAGQHNTCRRLIFFSKAYLAHGEDLKESMASFDSDIEDAIIVYHELRHVFDHIMGSSGEEMALRFLETQAHMATYESRGIKRDHKRREDILEEQLAGKDDESLTTRKGLLRDSYNQCFQNLQQIPREHWRKLSYAISTTNASLVPDLFQLLAEHYKN